MSERLYMVVCCFGYKKNDKNSFTLQVNFLIVVLYIVKFENNFVMTISKQCDVVSIFFLIHSFVNKLCSVS